MRIISTGPSPVLGKSEGQAVQAQPAAPRAGAFDPDRGDRSEGRGPLDQAGVAGAGGRKRCCREQPSEQVEHGGDVVVSVSVNANDDVTFEVWFDGHVTSFVSRGWR